VLCVSPATAGQRRWFKSNDAAEPPARHCGGTPVRRQRTGAGREPLGCWRRCLGTRAPLWSRGFMRLTSAAKADSRSPRPSRCTKAGALWQTPGEGTV